MKKLLLPIFIVITLVSCNNSKSTETPTLSDSSQVQEPSQTISSTTTQTEQAQTKVASVAKNERIEVLYFHGKKRCITCNNIERLTKEVLNKDFAKELKEGKIKMKVIDISLDENEKIADKYEVTWSSLLVNKWKGNKETVNDMTDFGFEYAKTQEGEFKKGLKEKIKSLL